MGLFPHPDDEAYAAAGTLALCAAGGAQVSVVCATRGEAGGDRSAGASRGPELAALRSRELAESCRALGAAPPYFLDLPDGALGQLEPEAAAAALCALLRRLSPHVVVTLGEDGVYGCSDHRAWTRIAMRAAGLAKVPRVLHCAFPRGLFAPLRRALRARVRGPRLIEDDVGDLGCGVADVDLRVDIRAVRERKWAAIAAHRSQLRGGDPDTFLRPGLIRELLAEEWFLLRAGAALPSAAGDPFAGL